MARADLARSALQPPWRALSMNPKLEQARLLLVNIYLIGHDDRSALEQLDIYFSKSASRSRPAELSALRAQLKSGGPHDGSLGVPVPACRE